MQLRKTNKKRQFFGCKKINHRINAFTINKNKTYSVMYNNFELSKVANRIYVISRSRLIPSSKEKSIDLIDQWRISQSCQLNICMYVQATDCEHKSIAFN